MLVYNEEHSLFFWQQRDGFICPLLPFSDNSFLDNEISLCFELLLLASQSHVKTSDQSAFFRAWMKPSNFLAIYLCTEVKLWDTMQVLSGLEKIHTSVGYLLILLHTIGVWLLQGIAREPLHIRHYWTGCFSIWHCFAVLACLQRHTDLSNGLQAHAYCSTVCSLSVVYFLHAL